MIETLTEFPDNVTGLVFSGYVTRQEFETMVIPTVDSALNRYESLRLYHQIGSDLTGMSPEAMWQDLKLDAAHITRWEQIAVVSDVNWIGNALKPIVFLMPGKIRLFSISDSDEARDWIARV